VEHALVEALGEDLTGYTVDGVAALIGPLAQAALGREHALPAVRALEAAHGPLATLAATFLLGCPTTAKALDAALPRLRRDGARGLGLVEAAGEGPDDEVRALVDLRPYAATDGLGTSDWWVVSDLGEMATGRRLAPEHVLGVGGASTTLAGYTVRRPARRVLDLGTGCGVQSLHASRHAASIVATDLSARALDFAAFTWALNRGTVSEVEFETRLGSMLVPVAGERFDLVVSNPPFVISPRLPDTLAYTYRDAGLPGDDLVRDLVRTVGEVLTEGGVAQFLGNWEFRRGEAWQERVGSWLDELTPESGRVDAWIVQREVQDPAEYAETWLRDGGQPRGPEFDRLYQAWLDDFDSRDVEGIGFGLVTLRRADEPGAGHVPLRRLEEQRGGDPAGLGDHVADALAALDWLTVHAGSLREHRFTVAPDVTEERHYRPGEEDPAVIQIRQGGGFGRVVRASTSLAAVVGACDGELSLGRITAAVAHLLDTSAAGVWDEIAEPVADLVRDAMLVPVGPPLT
jgi:ubiquinone/menaquinone biosynthesis C-methylase UbiE